MATGFGRKGTIDQDMAARRAAFIAAERARSQRAPEQPMQAAARHAGTSRKTPVYATRKSLGIAYLLWFVLGGFSAHRFYLGYTSSAVAQTLLWIGGFMMVFVGSFSNSLPMAFMGIASLGTGAIWILADAFLMPGLLERANRQERDREVGRVFA